MRRVLLEIKDKNFLSPLQQAQQSSSSSLNLDSSGFYLNIEISPMILLLIIVFSIVFCTYGLLHLLARLLWRPRNRDIDELDNVTDNQGRLQQLFNLHDSGVDQSFIDSGVDQSFIDALPVFNYKSIIGLKDPFDCAVCLCEFEDEDVLRLLAKCSHAFHMDCIDTWLLSHSTCPLCRDSLLHDFPPSRNCSPQVFVLESRSSETSREIVLARESNHSGNCNNEIGSRVNSQSSDEFLKMPLSRFLEKDETEIQTPLPPTPEVVAPSVEKFVPVKLGKYRNVDSVGEGSSTNNIVSRCLSMGSFAYVMDENAPLQVPIKPTAKKHSIKKHNLPLSPLHRAAMSECGFDSRRVLEESSSDINGIQETKTGSFSDSKTWLRGKINRNNSAKVESERGGSSFRFPLQRSVVAEDGMKNKSGNGERKAVSESEFDRRKDNGVSEYDCDDEVQSCNSMDSHAPHTPFARTLHWLMGRPNNVLHSAPSSNVSSHNHFNFI